MSWIPLFETVMSSAISFYDFITHLKSGKFSLWAKVGTMSAIVAPIVGKSAVHIIQGNPGNSSKILGERVVEEKVPFAVSGPFRRSAAHEPLGFQWHLLNLFVLRATDGSGRENCVLKLVYGFTFSRSLAIQSSNKVPELMKSTAWWGCWLIDSPCLRLLVDS